MKNYLFILLLNVSFDGQPCCRKPRQRADYQKKIRVVVDNFRNLVEFTGYFISFIKRGSSNANSNFFVTSATERTRMVTAHIDYRYTINRTCLAPPAFLDM